MAAKVVQRLCGFYPQSGASDPRIFAAGLITLIAEYPKQIIENLLSPISGIPAKFKFLPSIAETKEVCERYAQPLREVEYLEANRKRPVDHFLAPPREKRESIEDLRAKHGENWGLHPDGARKSARWMDLGQIAAKYGVDRKVAQALPDAPQRRS